MLEVLQTHVPPVYQTNVFINYFLLRYSTTSSLTNLLVILSFKHIPSDSKIAIFSIELLLILWKTTFFFIFTNPLLECNYQSLLFVFNLKSLLYSNLGALAICFKALLVFFCNLLVFLLLHILVKEMK